MAKDAKPATEMVRRIATRIVLVETDADAIEEMGRKAKTPLMAVFGRIGRTKTGQTDLGPYCKFYGEFHAVNLLTNKEFRAPTAAFPAVLADSLESQFAIDGTTALEFAGILGVQPRTGKGTKYEWYFQPAMEPTNDPLAKLRGPLNELISKLPALPRPGAKSE